MSAAKPAARPTGARLPPHKGRELVGIGLAVLALLLAGALLTYRPSDPSLLSDPPAGTPVRNLIGPLGAHLAAVGFELLGLAVLALPLLLGVAAAYRLRRVERSKVPGRSLGAGLTLVALPGLLQVTLSDVPWRGDSVAAGGLMGRWLSGFLISQTGFTGALLVLLGGVAVGFALLVQSSLGEILGGWFDRGRGLFDQSRFVLARRRERKDKDRARRRVEEKVLSRARERGGLAPFPPVETLRVRERTGRPPSVIRRMEAASARPAPPAPPTSEERARPPVPEAPAPPRRAPAKPQMVLPIPAATRDRLPPENLLRLDRLETKVEENELVRLGEVIRGRCAEFGVEGSIEGISPGPVITTYEFQPAPGVKVSQIVNLQDDLALALKAEAVRIDRLAGRSTLGIEVPNRERGLIRLGPLLDAEDFRRSPSLLTMAIGTTIHGEPYYTDLASMPHLLVAGATGSGKSVGLQSMITSILYKARREEVQFIFIDPKRIELGVYADIPHLKTEVVVEPKKAANALRWAVAEMERRYRMLAEVHVRNIDHYNRAIRDPEVQRRLALVEEEENAEATVSDLQPLPYYVVVIDELADLMMTSQAEVEASIARLAQMARAVGIHLIVATQRPSVDVLTGTIKANFPCRISFATATRHDSRTILDQVGAEKLLGRGDMLFMPPGTSRVLRLHGAYVSEQETAALIRWLKKRIGKPDLDLEVLQAPVDDRSGGSGGGDEDELYEEAARMVVAEGSASASFLQRRLRVGFSRAARLVDMMERDGLLGPPQGSKPREVLVKPDFFEEWDQARREVGD